MSKSTVAVTPLRLVITKLFKKQSSFKKGKTFAPLACWFYYAGGFFVFLVERLLCAGSNVELTTVCFCFCWPVQTFLNVTMIWTWTAVLFLHARKRVHTHKVHICFLGHCEKSLFRSLGMPLIPPGQKQNNNNHDLLQ